MTSLLEIVINEPFQADLLQHLYQNQQDLEKAHPDAKYPFCPKEWEEIINRDSANTSILFKRNHKVIGHLAFLINGEYLYLCFVIIERQHRNQKLAKEMISMSEEFCRLNFSHKELYLNVHKENTTALGLYKSMGYQVTNQHKMKTTMKKRLKK